MNDPSKKPLPTLKRSLQVWFSPQQLIDLTALVLLAAQIAHPDTLADEGITPEALSELMLKLNKEIERLG